MTDTITQVSFSLNNGASAASQKLNSTLFPFFGKHFPQPVLAFVERTRGAFEIGYLRLAVRAEM